MKQIPYRTTLLFLMASIFYTQSIALGGNPAPELQNWLWAVRHTHPVTKKYTRLYTAGPSLRFAFKFPPELDRPATSLAAPAPRYDSPCAHDQRLGHTHKRSLDRSRKNETARSAAASAARATKKHQGISQIQKPRYYCTTRNNFSMRAELAI